jgi:hypothetical protein
MERENEQPDSERGAGGHDDIVSWFCLWAGRADSNGDAGGCAQGVAEPTDQFPATNEHARGYSDRAECLAHQCCTSGDLTL